MGLAWLLVDGHHGEELRERWKNVFSVQHVHGVGIRILSSMC
jgi:hypothetical protein